MVLLISHGYFIPQAVGGFLSVENIEQLDGLQVRRPTEDLHVLVLVFLVLIVVAVVRVRLVLRGDAGLSEPGKLQAAQRLHLVRQERRLQRLATFTLRRAGERRGRPRGRRRPREETETLQIEKTLVPT